MTTMRNEDGEGVDHLRIPYEKIRFVKKLESGGYGSMFQGEVDHHHQQAAVALKQLNITNLRNVKPQLLADVRTISRFSQHPNLVPLLGFCDDRSNEITLVYEYVSGGSLLDRMRNHLTAIQRLEICLDAARGLHELHTGAKANTPGIAHGNITLSNILLNSSPTNSTRLEAKVSNFGLSRIVPGQPRDVVKGVQERATKESDVYSFGVLLLEVLCGVPKMVDPGVSLNRLHVVELVRKGLDRNTLRKIVHPDIKEEIKTESLKTYAKIGCQCVVEIPEERPSMADVVNELEKALTTQQGKVARRPRWINGWRWVRSRGIIVRKAYRQPRLGALFSLFARDVKNSKTDARYVMP